MKINLCYKNATFSRRISGFEVPSSNGSSGGEQGNSSLKKTLGYGPDLTSEVRNSPSDCFDYQFSDRASNCDSQKSRSAAHQPLLGLAQFNDFRPTSEHFYEQPMVVFPPSSASVSIGIAKAKLKEIFNADLPCSTCCYSSKVTS